MDSKQPLRHARSKFETYACQTMTIPFASVVVLSPVKPILMKPDGPS